MAIDIVVQLFRLHRLCSLILKPFSAFYHNSTGRSNDYKRQAPSEDSDHPQSVNRVCAVHSVDT